MVRLLVSAILFGFIAVPFMASADPFDDGVSCFERGDYATALQIWRPLAEHDPRAATNLGVMYAAGLGADRLREDALAYAMMRMQFGKPIASFQSMKHKQADMLLEVELAKSAAYYAAASLDDGDEDALANAHLAKACASDAYMQTAIHAVQIHGGIGFTWDNDTHLWFKRAKSSEVLLGDANYHRELMLQNWPA